MKKKPLQFRDLGAVSQLNSQSYPQRLWMKYENRLKAQAGRGVSIKVRADIGSQLVFC